MVNFYFFRKYVPMVKTMNESMNEWMKKMAVTRVDKNEFFLTKRTHKPDLGELDKPFNRYILHFQSFGSLPYYHNNYMKFISYYYMNTGLELDKLFNSISKLRYFPWYVIVTSHKVIFNYSAIVFLPHSLALSSASIAFHLVTWPVGPCTAPNDI